MAGEAHKEQRQPRHGVTRFHFTKGGLFSPNQRFRFFFLHGFAGGCLANKKAEAQKGFRLSLSKKSPKGGFFGKME